MSHSLIIAGEELDTLLLLFRYFEKAKRPACCKRTSTTWTTTAGNRGLRNSVASTPSDLVLMCTAATQ